jgi:hypothetical protein
MKAIVEGKEVKVGDWVGFKCDIEQYGQIIEIKDGGFLSPAVVLVLQNENGFDGGYIGGQTITEETADRCWL